MRVMGIDPGEKRIGVALSDPTGTIANPLTVVKTVSRLADAATLAQLATDNQVGLIVVGWTLDDEGQATPQGRRSARLAEALRAQTPLPVVLWDEDFSTQAALAASIALGVPASKRRRQGHGHLDQLAATVILQTYLDAHPQ
jgi:putative Holliday junction resolvase